MPKVRKDWRAAFAEESLNSVNLYYQKCNCGGYYDGSDIYLNLNSIPIADFFDVAKNLLDTDSTVSKKGYTPILIHELEHARRNDLSEKSFHNKFILPDGEKVAFDICANEYAREAKNKGLIIDWRKKMESSLENKNIAQTLDKLIAFVKQGPKEERFAIKILGIEDKRI